MERKREKICVLCNKPFTEMGNDPWPLADKGRCCDKCNELVVEERIKLITADNPD